MSLLHSCYWIDFYMFIQRSTFCSWAVNFDVYKRKKIRKDWFIAIGWPISGFIWGIIFTQFNVRHPNNKTHGKRLQDIFYINIFFNTISCQILWERIFLLIFKSSWNTLLSTFQQEFSLYLRLWITEGCRRVYYKDLKRSNKRYVI